MEPEIGCGFLRTDSLETLLSFIHPEFAIIDAISVCGFPHLFQAAELSLMAHKGDYNLSKDKSTEVLLYLTGQRQISKALELAGLSSETKSIAWVSFLKLPEKLFDFVEPDDNVISHYDFDYSRFNINKDLDLDLKQKIVMTKTAVLPVQSR